MRQVEARQGLRLVKFVEVYIEAEAAEILGMSERTFRRWRVRYREEGEAGLHDRRLGKISPSKVAMDEIEQVLPLYRERYNGFRAKHFHEKLIEHGFRYTWTKLRLQKAGLIERAPRRSKHGKKRPLRGMLTFPRFPGHPAKVGLFGHRGEDHDGEETSSVYGRVQIGGSEAFGGEQTVIAVSCR